MDSNASPEGSFRFFLGIVVTVGFSTWVFFFSLPALLSGLGIFHPQENRTIQISEAKTPKDGTQIIHSASLLNQ